METVAENLYKALRLARVVVEFYENICSPGMAKTLRKDIEEIDRALKAYDDFLVIERHNRNVVDLVNKAMGVK
jgi:hypothetical protein